MRYLIAIVVLVLFVAVTWQSSNSYWRFKGNLVVDADTLAVLFPDKQFNLKDGKLNYSSSVVLVDMWSIIDTVIIDSTDTGKTVKEAIIKWSTNLIYQLNLLELDKSKWEVK